tara:strand:- start:94 stop:375 length:282 start_codon:yes stop_codon:yes gene_type:complete
MANFDKAAVYFNSENFLGYKGNPPTNEAEYNLVKNSMFSKNPPAWNEIETKIQEYIDKELTDEQKETAKQSGKAKLKAGEALTDAEITALFGD